MTKKCDGVLIFQSTSVVNPESISTLYPEWPDDERLDAIQPFLFFISPM